MERKPLRIRYEDDGTAIPKRLKESPFDKKTCHGANQYLYVM
jgi:hypothetical protein